ncbi:MAG: tRNA U34 5-methylaminomethyl-2-thiouridine-forming methyltransferase MnmC [Crocinitomicaceae bacterium]|jgi:tRNA U34 5-methylaminomethyl-2-thiouridine-forming methyltransferase MnmC
MERKVQLTEDGSSTIYIPEMDETYHSTHGAIQEANHVFLKHGIETLNQNPIAVFEMGFGTGLNALLTSEFANSNQIEVVYKGIEAFPVEEELIKSLNYAEEIEGNSRGNFELIHSTDWNIEQQINAFFALTKIHEKIEDFVPIPNSIDIVYYDAFGPRAQGEMWQKCILEKMYKMLKPNGIFVTYCAMGQFKRDLKAIGFTVEGKPGPPGKREMTVGIKSA